MNPDEVRGLLSVLAGYDRWLANTDPETAQAMMSGWADLLSEVPQDFAVTFCRAHYGTPGARTVQPGDISGAWRDETYRRAQAADEEARRHEPAALPSGPPTRQAGIEVGHPADYLAAMVAAVRAGGDPRDVTRPAGVAVLTPYADEMARRCVYHALCACTHTECRAGWLDSPGVIVNGLGRRYESAQRCPHCRDALIMAEERGIAKKPSRTQPGARR